MFSDPTRIVEGIVLIDLLQLSSVARRRFGGPVRAAAIRKHSRDDAAAPSPGNALVRVVLALSVLWLASATSMPAALGLLVAVGIARTGCN